MVRVHPAWRLSTALSWPRPCIDHAWPQPGRPTQTAAPRSCAPSVRSLRQTARDGYDVGRRVAGATAAVGPQEMGGSAPVARPERRV